VTPRKLYTFAIDPDLADALKRAKDETGAAESEIVRRAIREWMESRGYMKAERKRAVTRKRP
jgi:hypothetical protein